jgi:Fur family ferric uptake transcriptional regulator
MASRTMADADRIARMRGLLTAAGHAWTRPRSTVLQVLLGAPTPLKVEEIHGRLGHRPGGRRINLSSVYRTVNLLSTLHIVRRVRLGGGPLRYELADDAGEHRHHLVCELCGRIENVGRCPLEGADLGRRVRSHHLELFGVCGSCHMEESR